MFWPVGSDGSDSLRMPSDMPTTPSVPFPSGWKLGTMTRTGTAVFDDVKAVAG